MRAAANANTTAETNFIPPDEDEANNISCFAKIADKQTGTMYTGQPGALPHMSLDGIQYFFVAYNYNTNYIYALLIENLKDVTIITTMMKFSTTSKPRTTNLHSMRRTTRQQNQ